MGTAANRKNCSIFLTNLRPPKPYVDNQIEGFMMHYDNSGNADTYFRICSISGTSDSYGDITNTHAPGDLDKLTNVLSIHRDDGNVGIKKDVPRYSNYSLDVNGSAQFSGDLSVNGNITGLPIADKDTSGIVKIGSNLEINSGTLSLDTANFAMLDSQNEFTDINRIDNLLIGPVYNGNTGSKFQGIMWSDNMNSSLNSYALIQTAPSANFSPDLSYQAGTYLNARAGEKIRFEINGEPMMKLNSNGDVDISGNLQIDTNGDNYISLTTQGVNNSSSIFLNAESYHQPSSSFKKYGFMMQYNDKGNKKHFRICGIDGTNLSYEEIADLNNDVYDTSNINPALSIKREIGNVGIKKDPDNDYSLDVSGDVFIAGDLSINGNCEIGNVGIKKDPDNDYSLDVSGDVFIAGDLSINGNLTVSGNLIINGNLILPNLRNQDNLSDVPDKGIYSYNAITALGVKVLAFNSS